MSFKNLFSIIGLGLVLLPSLANSSPFQSFFPISLLRVAVILKHRVRLSTGRITVLLKSEYNNNMFFYIFRWSYNTIIFK